MPSSEWRDDAGGITGFTDSVSISHQLAIVR